MTQECRPQAGGPATGRQETAGPSSTGRRSEHDLPLNARVECTDGRFGTSTYVVLDPRTRRVTHVVVRTRHFPYAEHLVPVERIGQTTPALILLRATRREAEEMPPFTQVDDFEPGGRMGTYPAGSVLFWPYGTYVDPLAGPEPLLIERELIPPGETAVGRGTAVEATDGRVGRVDDLLVDPATGRVTHLVLREGHLWGQRDVTIPVAAIAELGEATVRLTLDKKAVGELPAVPVGDR
jgi:sporulation protein YlmC with PRC-barrel domain